MSSPTSQAQPPAAAATYDLADVQAYIRATSLYDPQRIHEAALAAGLDATQLDGIYGLAPGTAAAYIATQRWAPLPGGATVVGLGPAQPVAITPTSALAYGRTATFALTGSNLSPSNLSISVTNCAGLALAAGGNATARTLTCKPASTGALTVQARNLAGSELLAASFTVPEPQVTVATSQGTVVLELNPAQAPVTVNNFLTYVNDGFYTSTLFHRVISGFMVQGGGFTGGMALRSPTYPAITLESANGLSNLRGTVAMARTSAANSATSQFFINQVDNLFLNYSSATSPGYAVFGRVVSGMDVVDRIASLPTRTVGAFQDVPQTDVTIQSALQTR
ncbi:MAG: peptidylprolyl isomerase [Ramlibacter sp.]